MGEPDAEQQLCAHLARLCPGYRKAQHAIGKIGELWAGSLPGGCFRPALALAVAPVPPTLHAAERVASFIHDERPEVRAQVLQALGLAVEHAAAFVDEVVLALHDPAPAVRIAAARLIPRLGPLRDEMIALVRTALADPVWSIRWALVPVLAGRVPAAELASVLVASVPRPRSFAYAFDDWLRAARSIQPMPAALEGPVAVVERCAAHDARQF